MRLTLVVPRSLPRSPDMAATREGEERRGGVGGAGAASAGGPDPARSPGPGPQARGPGPREPSSDRGAVQGASAVGDTARGGRADRRSLRRNVCEPARARAGAREGHVGGAGELPERWRRTGPPVCAAGRPSSQGVSPAIPPRLHKDAVCAYAARLAVCARGGEEGQAPMWGGALADDLVGAGGSRAFR